MPGTPNQQIDQPTTRSEQAEQTPNSTHPTHSRLKMMVGRQELWKERGADAGEEVGKEACLWEALTGAGWPASTSIVSCPPTDTKELKLEVPGHLLRFIPVI